MRSYLDYWKQLEDLSRTHRKAITLVTGLGFLMILMVKHFKVSQREGQTIEDSLTDVHHDLSEIGVELERLRGALREC